MQSYCHLVIIKNHYEIIRLADFWVLRHFSSLSLPLFHNVSLSLSFLFSFLSLFISVSLHLCLSPSLLISSRFSSPLCCCCVVAGCCCAFVVCVGWLVGWLVGGVVVVWLVVCRRRRRCCVSLWLWLWLWCVCAVWRVVWHAENTRVQIQNASVCTFKTSPRAPATSPHV